MIKAIELLTPQIRAELLASREDRDRITGDLQALQQLPGWIFIERVLKFHVEAMGQQILNDDTMNPEVEKDIKRERAFLLLFKTMPGEWVKDLMARDPSTEIVDPDDPYK